MESALRGLRVLQADAAWFARAKELRLLHVSTTGELGAPSLQVCLGQEFHADNRSFYFGFEDPFLLADDGWSSRSKHLRAEYERKREANVKTGLALGALHPAPPSGQGLAEFAALLQEILACLVTPLSGLIVVLAPVRIESGAPFAAQVEMLMKTPALAAVRWIIIERDTAAAVPLADNLGPKALKSQWSRDEQAANLELAAMIGPLDPSLGLPGHIPKPPTWQPPGAGPDVEAPPRKNAPKPPSDEELRAQGLSPEFMMGGGQALSKLILAAALAQREKRPADALRLQGVAADLCGRMGMFKAQVINTLILGSYFLGAGSSGQARQTYTRAADQASAQQLKDEEAQAHLSLGMLDATEGKHQAAMGHYSAAGEIAEASGNAPLAIECWRTAGQLAYNVSAFDAALKAWTRALKLADAMDPKQVKATTAAEAARGVAAILQSGGQTIDATRFQERAYRYEQGLPPDAPIPA